MMRLDRQKRAFVSVSQRGIAEAGLLERTDLQQMIRQSPDVFFNEMGERLLLLGEEVRPDGFVDDRIDLLALDEEGAIVVIEIKRGNDKLQLLQAISYAAMISHWDRELLIKKRVELTNRPLDEVEEEIEDFLVKEMTDLNESQRIVLLAENFDYEVLVAAEWLTEHYDVDVRCYRLALSVDTTHEYLSCTCIYPPPELTQVAVRRRASPPRERPWTNWEEAIAAIENPAVSAFFRREIDRGHEGPWRSRALRFQINGRPRFTVKARRKSAYVWQRGRFKDDIQFWASKLGDGPQVSPVKNGEALRFFLSTEAEFRDFSNALEKELLTTEFLTEGPDADDEGSEAEQGPRDRS